MRNILFIILATVLLFSCKHELERPGWDVEMLLPIAHTKLNINNIISDTATIINEDENGLISLVYQQSLLDLNYDSLLLLETKSEEKSIKIDSVNFDDVVIDRVIPMGSIVQQDPLIAFLLPDGSQRQIPALAGVVQNDTISIDASEYFETMTLYNGMLNIKLTNGFPTDIANISFALYNANTQNILATFYAPLITSGSTYSESVSVAGETLDYLMIGLISNIDVNESSGQVLIDYSDAITTTISITEIKIMEATAYFPNQLLYEEYHEEPFDIGSAKLTEIGIKEGNVTINALSTLPDTGTILYEIPSLTKNGIPFETIVKVPPNTTGEATKFKFNFDGYIMDLTGKDGREGGDTVNTIYATLRAYLDSTGELETIHQVDSLYTFNEYSFTPEYAKGYIGQDTLNFGPEIIETQVFNLITSGNISLNNADIHIGINNYIGADAAVIINNLSAINEDTEVNAVFDNTFIHNIQRASLSANNNITPTNTKINIPAKEMLEIFPNKINTSATFYLNPNGQVASEDFLFLSKPIAANLGVEIPLSFIANNLTLSNTTNVSSSNNELIEIIYITIENGLPLEANIKLIALDETNQVIDTLMNNQDVLAAQTSLNGIVTENSTSILEINNIDFTNIKSINVVAKFNTKELQEYTNIYSEYEMDITISAKIKNRIGL